MAQPHKRAAWEAALGLVPFPAQERQRFELACMPPGGWPWEWKPIWSFDNPSIHGGVGGALVLQALGIPKAQHFELTVRSSDIHKVIEHTHARLVGQFEDWYYIDPQPYELSVYKGVLEQLFYTRYEVASAEVIMEDVQSMPGTLAKVISAAGGEIGKPWR